MICEQMGLIRSLEGFQYIVWKNNVLKMERINRQTRGFAEDRNNIINTELIKKTYYFKNHFRKANQPTSNMPTKMPS